MPRNFGPEKTMPTKKQRDLWNCVSVRLREDRGDLGSLSRAVCYLLSSGLVSHLNFWTFHLLLAPPGFRSKVAAAWVQKCSGAYGDRWSCALRSKPAACPVQ